MKRVGFLYEKICDIENIKAAIKNASRRKRKRREVRRVLSNIDECAEQVRKMLLEQNYDLVEGKHKLIYDGSQNKIRKITIPRFFPDQVIHWALMQVTQPIFMRGMYEYSCGSVPNRGGKAVKRYMEKILRNDKEIQYVAKFDIKKYFPSISHDKLKQLLRDKIKCPRTITLFDKIIDVGGAGLPIGYYTSQWLANFYLEKVDHYFKEQLGIRHYIRYVDDMVLLDTGKDKLHNARIALDEYMCKGDYNTHIKENWQVWKLYSRPIDFVGYRYYNGYTLLRKRLFYRLCRTFNKIDKNGLKITYARRATSLIGWAKHINFRKYYIDNLKQIISKNKITSYIGRRDKKVKIGA